MKNIKISQNIAYLSMLLAISLILSYVESLFSFIFLSMGMKIGLTNIITLIGLKTCGKIKTFIIVLLRVFIVSLLFGNSMKFMLSISGFLFSFIIMIICIDTLKFSTYFTSMIGGVFHNIGQIIALNFFVKTPYIFSILPLYIFTGLLAGLVVGVVSNTVLKILLKYKKDIR